MKFWVNVFIGKGIVKCKGYVDNDAYTFTSDFMRVLFTRFCFLRPDGIAASRRFLSSGCATMTCSLLRRVLVLALVLAPCSATWIGIQAPSAQIVEIYSGAKIL